MSGTHQLNQVIAKREPVFFLKDESSVQLKLKLKTTNLEWHGIQKLDCRAGEKSQHVQSCAAEVIFNYQ